ncbi:GTPase HflX [Hyphomicrobium sp. NDB2Meth4]|uniref:GTPase HflX n=1 Tax=Hyphomicrobium sp. NDB2Meth4 TaxID=1892846 RepID=UPI0009310DFE|nr:GTPase HflX [Hyphomicrobium sp. NDB2Meth4]
MLVPDFKRATRPPRVEAGAPSRTAPLHSPHDRLQEAIGLSEAIDLDVRDSMLVPVATPRPATLFGTGKVESLKAMIAAHEIALVIIDHPVSPIQQRNLERAWNTKVLDRTGLILEIFGRRARTREGRLQVELAHLSYQKSRLVRTWTHLERQRGGYGFLGGPGEAQIELDRRMIDERIMAIRKELEVVVRTRELHRQGRRRVPYPVVAIVGYTNAGKSTLFNRITGADVFAKHQLFATLDPTMREVRLKSGRRIILSDTVGFISDLPTMLVAAFRATLEEVIEADLILHVRDISHEETDSQAHDVEQVLADLGIDTLAADAPILEVWNKVDLLSAITREEAISAARFAERRPVLVSAVSGEGIDRLLDEIDKRLGRSDSVVEMLIPAHGGRLVNWLYEEADVIEREPLDSGETRARVRVAAEKKERLLAQARQAGAIIEAST